MTVQKDVTKNIYVGNSSTRTFPFTFECPAEHPEYIKVYLMQDDGTALATSDYQLDMDAKQITYPSSGTALPEGKKLVIMRELPLQQMMNLVNNGPYFAEDIETAFDECVMAMQQIAEKLNRSIIMSVDIDGDAFVNEVPFEAGKSFRIADDGKSIVLTEDPAKVLPLVQGVYAQTQTQAQNAIASAAAAAKSESSTKAYMDTTKDLSENVNVFVPSVDADGTLTWTNKAGLDNPAAVNVKGAKGEKGDTGPQGPQGVQGLQGLQGPAGNAATITIGNVTTSAPGTSASVTNRGTSSAAVLDFVLPKGKDGADGGVTVDEELSDTSVNPVQNKAVKAALDNRAVLDEFNTFTSPNTFDVIYMQKGIGGIRWYEESPSFVTGHINATSYTGEANTAKKATKDGNGNVITSTYATKTELSSCVKSVNNVTPDENGNVSISVSGGGGGSNITVDAELSATSTNPVQNKAIYNALLNKVGTDIFSGFALMGATSTIAWRQGSQNIGSINATNYTGTAARATQDGAGNVITETYATKADINGVVKTVNNTAPDENGNVTIAVSSGSGISTSESNTWTAEQMFYTLMLNREKYTTYVVNGTSDTPITSTMVYAVTGAFTLDLATLAGALSASQSSVFTAYFAANADYSLTISNAGNLKYVGSASDVAITSAGLLLNIWMSKDGGGTLTSIVQASKLS